MIEWAAANALATSIVILAVLMLRRPVAGAFGANAAYALWLAPAARAILPPVSLPQIPLTETGSIASSASYALVTEQASAGTAWTTILIGLWLGGAAVYLALHWWRHQQFLGGALADGRPLDIAGTPYDVVASSRVEGPLATGLIHPLILVPADFESRFSPEQQRLALLHEQSHHRRGDIWASLVAMLIAAFLWFNPFAHMALRAFRRDMEAACDARVVALSGEGSASPYAETILRSVSRPAPRSLCALTAVDELKGRLIMLSKSYGPVRKFAGLALAIGLTAGGLMFAGPATADQTKPEENREVRRIEIREYRGDKALLDREQKEGQLLALNCPGEKVEIESEGGSGGKQDKVKMVFCARQGESLVAALENAAADIEKRNEMPADRKADMLGKLRAKISELKAKG